MFQVLALVDIAAIFLLRRARFRRYTFLVKFAKMVLRGCIAITSCPLPCWSLEA